MRRYVGSLDCPKLNIQIIIPVDATLRQLDGGIMFYLHEHGITIDNLMLDVLHCCLHSTAAPMTRESIAFNIPIDDMLETLEYNNINHDQDTVILTYTNAVYVIYTKLFPWIMDMFYNKGLRDLSNPQISAVRFDREKYVLNNDELYLQVEIEEGA